MLGIIKGISRNIENNSKINYRMNYLKLLKNGQKTSERNQKLFYEICGGNLLEFCCELSKGIIEEVSKGFA